MLDHLATIGEVSVHHMLGEPVLDKVDKVTVEGDREGFELLGERLVLGDVVLGPLLKVGDLQELSLLVVEVIMHLGLQGLVEIGVIGLPLFGTKSIKKYLTGSIMLKRRDKYGRKGPRKRKCVNTCDIVQEYLEIQVVDGAISKS